MKTIQHCKHCGATDIKNGFQTNEMSTKKYFGPELHVNAGPVNIGASIASIGKTDTVEYCFPTKKCQTCLNILVTNDNVDTKPLELCTTSNLPIVIIPYILYTTLTSYGYGYTDVYDLVVRIKRQLSIILNKWKKSGINQCKCDRLGFKTSLPLKNNSKLECWVIIDQIRAKLAYRIVYGGKKVSCQ